MRSVIFTVVCLGPVRRPSVVKWLLQRNCVYFGMKNEAVCGSGFYQSERIKMEKEQGKYIHFSSRADMDNAIESFAWNDFVIYNFGYHPHLMSGYLVEAFIERVQYYFSRLSIDVKFERTFSNMTTLYLSNYCVDKRHSQIRTFLRSLMQKPQQCVYIGAPSMTHVIAMEVTASFTDLIEAVQKRIPEPVDTETLLPYLEIMLSRDPNTREMWLSRFIQKIRTLAVNYNMFQDGARCIINVSDELEELQIGKYRFRPDLHVSSSPYDIPMRDLFGGGKTSGVYEMHPGLLRLEGILSYTQIDAELRYEGSIGCDTGNATGECTVAMMMEEYADGIHIPGICAHHGIVPALDMQQYTDFMNVHKRAYVLATFGRTIHPCCQSIMNTQQFHNKPHLNSDVVSINASKPPQFFDKRKVIREKNRPTQADFWPTDSIIWSTGHSKDTCNYETKHVARYVSSHLNQCQWTLDDYKFLQRNPNGTLDHMLRYHVDGTMRPIGLEPIVKFDAPQGDLDIKRQKN